MKAIAKKMYFMHQVRGQAEILNGQVHRLRRKLLRPRPLSTVPKPQGCACPWHPVSGNGLGHRPLSPAGEMGPRVGMRPGVCPSTLLSPVTSALRLRLFVPI